MTGSRVRTCGLVVCRSRPLLVAGGRARDPAKPVSARSGRAGLVPETWWRDCRRCGSAFVARPEPGDVTGGRAGGVVLRLEPGVLAEPGDVKSGAWPAGAGREAQFGLGHGLGHGLAD